MDSVRERCVGRTGPDGPTLERRLVSLGPEELAEVESCRLAREEVLLPKVDSPAKSTLPDAPSSSLLGAE